MHRINLIYIVALVCGLLMLFMPGYDVQISFGFWIALMVYCAQDVERRLLLMLFAFTVFVFCMSRIVIPAFYTNSYIQTSQYFSMCFGEDVHNFIARTSFIALLCALIGFNSVRNDVCSDGAFHIDPNSRQINRIRTASKYLYLTSSVLVVYSIYTRFSFVAAFGYMDSFVNYSSSLPPILYKFASINALCLYLFLATLPTKKEAKPILLVFVLITVLTLFTGALTKFVMNFITLLVYLVLRNRINPNDKWLTRRGKIVIISALPFLTALMFLVMLIRGESSISNISFIDMIVNSIYQQGSIIDVLGISYEEADKIPYRLWSFGRIIDNYSNNFIFQLLGIGRELRSNTVDMAVNGHSLANYLTYTYQTVRFLSGGGMGSSFLAESWLDFGYFGVAGFSYIYGIILAKFIIWAKRNVWLFALSFDMVNAILYSPRAGAGDFIADLLSPMYLLTLFLIYQYSKK